MDAPLSTAGAPLDDLLELVQSMRRELRRRDEAPSGEWVEQSANDLRSGTKVGWYYPVAAGGGLAFYATQGREAYGHVHAGEGPEAADRTLRLAHQLLDSLPATVGSIDVGFTGLAAEAERKLLSQISERPGSTVIDRLALERELGPPDADGPGAAPDHLTLVPARAVTVEALADLDRRAFSGTVDELLIGPSPDDYVRVLRAMLGGSLGRFLDEASVALLVPDPPTLVGALLSGEQTPRTAIFLDFLVDPAARGRGYGRYLLRWGFRALFALGYSSVRLWVTSANASARHLYDALGFRTVATAAIYRWERAPAGPQPHAVR